MVFISLGIHSTLLPCRAFSLSTSRFLPALCSVATLAPGCSSDTPNTFLLRRLCLCGAFHLEHFLPSCQAAAPVWGFSRGTTGSSGSLSCGNREVRSPWAGQGGARHCSQVRVGESGLMTGRKRTLDVFLGLRQETLGSLDLCR